MRSVWIGRSVLALVALMFVRLGLAYLISPSTAVAESHITLASPGAMTAMRVVGTIFLVLAAFLLQCLPERRVSFGLRILTTLAFALVATRLVGRYVDGPDPFTSKVLVPEVLIAIIAAVALAIERWRTTTR